MFRMQVIVNLPERYVSVQEAKYSLSLETFKMRVRYTCRKLWSVEPKAFLMPFAPTSFLTFRAFAQNLCITTVSRTFAVVSHALAFSL